MFFQSSRAIVGGSEGKTLQNIFDQVPKVPMEGSELGVVSSTAIKEYVNLLD